MPVVAGMGGNATQSMAVTVRGLAFGQIFFIFLGLAQTVL